MTVLMGVESSHTCAVEGLTAPSLGTPSPICVHVSLRLLKISAQCDLLRDPRPDIQLDRSVSWSHLTFFSSGNLPVPEIIVYLSDISLSAYLPTTYLGAGT